MSPESLRSFPPTQDIPLKSYVIAVLTIATHYVHESKEFNKHTSLLIAVVPQSCNKLFLYSLIQIEAFIQCSMYVTQTY